MSSVPALSQMLLAASTIPGLSLGLSQAAAQAGESAGCSVQTGCVIAVQAAQQIKQVLAARGAASGSNIGVGVVAMNSFEDATAWLKVRISTSLFAPA